MTDITLISHSGNRALDTFERTIEAIDPSLVEPVVEILVKNRFGESRWNRVFRIGDRHFFGGSFEQFLRDVEIDGTTVRFDGEVPHLDIDGCHQPPLVVTEDSIFVGTSMSRPLVVLLHGRPALVPTSLGEMRWATNRRSGSMLELPVRLTVEPLPEGTEGVIVHDPDVADLIGFAKESAEFSRQRLRELSTRMWEVADRIVRRAEGETDHESVRHLYLHAPMSDLTRHSENLTIAEAITGDWG